MLVCPQCGAKYPPHKTRCFLDQRELVQVKDPREGTVLAGQYQIERVLGEGGMAIVYEASHRFVERRYAVKIMKSEFSQNEIVRERFRREARAAQKLAHPNIIEILDQGETEDGSLYLVMELLRGESLADLMDRVGRIPLNRTLLIAAQTAQALARAHDLEVVHRDLKPENIFLMTSDDSDAEGSECRVKLLDFGIARTLRDSRITAMGEVFGTPEYMAPERITSIHAGPPADLYSLGVILYELAVGHMPFVSDNPVALFKKHMTQPAPDPRVKNPDVPDALADLILRLLAKNPEQRPVDAHRVLKDLTAVARAHDIRIPTERPLRQSGIRGPTPSLAPVALDQWLQRASLFQSMLAVAYPTDPPRALTELLVRVRALLAEIRQLRRQAVQAQRSLQDTETQSHNYRSRIGSAVEALGVDLSQSRDALRSATEASHTLEKEERKRREDYLRNHRALLAWEGRSAFSEPYPELAEAYRKTADSVVSWNETKQALTAEHDRIAREQRAISDLEYQIAELRTALTRKESELGELAARKQGEVADFGRQAEKLEQDLLRVASEFCEPLREKPELKALFQRLETEAAA